MQFLLIASFSLLLFRVYAAGTAYAAARAAARDAVDLLAKQGIKEYESFQPLPNNNCTVENAVRRQEWSDLPLKTRRSYVSAVKCLIAAPRSKAFENAPGIVSRYDEFVYVHANMAFTTHYTIYIWAYEQALRNECGYIGYSPYWNWGRYSSDPIKHPIFDGSDASLSGNGGFYNHTGTKMISAPAPYDILPPAGGGGCLLNGPFKDTVINLGPFQPGLSGITPNNQSDGLGYNPRCLRRDINPIAAAVTATNYTMLQINKFANDINGFQIAMFDYAEDRSWGIHAGGHYTFGGDPASDTLQSPNDPVFWPHHTMLDRVWWIWQTRNLTYGLQAIGGTRTFNNTPPSPLATLDDEVGLLHLGAPVILRDLLNTVGGKGGDFCYVYV
ncbi:unnamed protein product [Diplocarpon coronariae]